MNVSVNVPWVTFLLAINVTTDLIGCPCRLSTEGLILHVELAGAPEQLRVTEPVRPPIGVTVMV
jgi:hypothetical protein